jgi:short-subunit dehydrogenase
MTASASSSKGTALITGASSGIGAVYADRLARRGYDLILVARNRGRLDDLAKRLHDDTGRTVRVVAADLNDKVDLARVETLLRTDAGITVLVNNAGVAAVTPLLDSNVDAMDDMITLNVRALTRLTYAAAPGLVARGGGAIVNIASIVGIAPERLNGVYGASKAYVIALSQSLHKELADKECARPGRAARRHRHRPLGEGGTAGRTSAKRDRDEHGRHGRRRACRTRSGRIDHHPIAARRRRLGGL